MQFCMCLAIPSTNNNPQTTPCCEICFAIKNVFLPNGEIEYHNQNLPPNFYNSGHFMTLGHFFPQFTYLESEVLKTMPCKEDSGQLSCQRKVKNRVIDMEKDLSRMDRCLRNLWSMQRPTEADVIVMYVRGGLIPSLPALKNKRNIGIWKSWFGMSNLRQIYKALIFQRAWSASSEM